MCFAANCLYSIFSLVGSAVSSSHGRFVLGVGGGALGGYLVTEGIWKGLECRRARVDSQFQDAIEVLQGVIKGIENTSLTSVDWCRRALNCETGSFLQQPGEQEANALSQEEQKGSQNLEEIACGLKDAYLALQFDRIKGHEVRWRAVALGVGAAVGLVAGVLIPGRCLLKVTVGVVGGCFGVLTSAASTLSRVQED